MQVLKPRASQSNVPKSWLYMIISPITITGPLQSSEMLLSHGIILLIPSLLLFAAFLDSQLHGSPCGLSCKIESLADHSQRTSVEEMERGVSL